MTNPATPKPTNASGALAGRIVLACADDDGGEVARILGQAATARTSEPSVDPAGTA